MIDPRGPHAAAWITTAVLAVAAVGVLAGSTVVLSAAVGLALAATLGAAGLCPGFEPYLLRTNPANHRKSGVTA